MNIAFVYDDRAIDTRGATCVTSTENSDFPGRNLIDPNRRIVWKPTAGGSTATITLPSSMTIQGFGVHNVTGNPGTVTLAGTGPGTVHSAAWVSGDEDLVKAFYSGSAITGYAASVWTFTFSGSGFSIGKLSLGIAADFGHIYSAGSEYGIERPGVRVKTFSQVPVDMPWALPHRTFNYKWRASSDADRAIFDAIARQEYPFGLLDPTGASNHVVLSEDGVTFGHVFMNNWDIEIKMEQLR
jgi:hypothetical protein